MFLTVIKSWKEKSLQATLDSVIMEISTRFCAPLIPRKQELLTKTPDTLPSALNSSKMEKLQK